MREGFNYGDALRSGRREGTQWNRYLEIENWDLQIAYRALSDSEMKTGARAGLPLHPRERASGGEAAAATPTCGSVSPSPSDGEGAGGEAASGPPTIGYCSPSPQLERGLGGVVIDCFRVGTQGKTQNGWHPIETIRQGDLVWTHLHRLRPVAGVQMRPHVGKLLGLRLDGSSHVVWCTPEQQFLVAQEPHPPTPSPLVERGSREAELGVASSLTPRPPLHRMERGNGGEARRGSWDFSPVPPLHLWRGGWGVRSRRDEELLVWSAPHHCGTTLESKAEQSADMRSHLDASDWAQPVEMRPQ